MLMELPRITTSAELAGRNVAASQQAIKLTAQRERGEISPQKFLSEIEKLIRKEKERMRKGAERLVRKRRPPGLIF